jgi:predicted anti-sigma-YlaC factor YlaD
MGLFSCKRFRRLVHEDLDRELTIREQTFLEAHRRSCASCRLAATQGALALSMLRMAAMDPEPAPQFEERVLRRYKVEAVRASLQFWSPALVGALVAGVAVLAALQIVSNSARLPALPTPGGQAFREVGRSPAFPDIGRTPPRSIVR